jgi:hypothetical protein
VSGKGNLDRIDYWVNSLKFNRAILETALEVRKLRDAIDIIKKENDINRQRQMATELALPVRLQLAGKWEAMTNLLMARMSTTGEMGILANLEMHNGHRLQYLTGQDAFLNGLGVSLPPEAFPQKEFHGTTRVIVPTNQSILEKGEDFYLRVRVLTAGSSVNGKIYWRALGKGNFKSMELKKMDRHVFEVTVPASEIPDHFEYFIEITVGDKVVKFPVTTPEINRTVVLF